MPVNLFDANVYRAANSDLQGLSDAQALSHFQNYGLNEGRHFSPFVDLDFYRASNSDLASFTNRQAYEHLQNYGVREGREFSPFFDLNFYQANNRDLANFNNQQLFEHLRNYGIGEGRRFSPFVDLNFYRNVNGDLTSLNNNQALQHLATYGLSEGRRFSPFVDINLYQAANPDLFAVGFDNNALLQHLENYGVTEGRRFSVSFDSNYYRSTYPDLAGFSNTQLLAHFENYGLNEGRVSSESFDVNYYLTNNSDFKALKFNNQQAQQHFEIYGFRESRFGAPASSISPSPDRDDNTLSTAFNFGVLNGSRNFTNQFVGTTERDDYYRFTLAQTSNLKLSLTGLTDSAEVDLIFDNNGNGEYDSGEQISYTSGSKSSNGSIVKTLGSGTYYIHVHTNDLSYNTNYTLGVSATSTLPTTPRDPGSTLGTALDIGTVSTSRSFTNFVGSADRNDYYRFTLAQTSNFNLSLTGLTDSAEVVMIYDSNNNGQYDSSEQISYTSGSKYGNGSNTKTLGAGTYFIRVYTNDTSYNTNYTLGVSATASPPTTPKDPGSTLGTALDISTLSGNRIYRDFVGSVDREDWYRFNLSSNRNFSLNLTGLTDSAEVDLIQDSNNNGQYDDYYYDTQLGYTYGSNSSNGSIVKTLGSGTYYIRVHTNDTSYNTNYTLTLLA